MKNLRRMLLLGAILLCLMPLTVYAEDGEAKNVSGSELIADSTGFDRAGFLFDEKIYVGRRVEPGAALTLHCPEGIGSLYFIFDETDTRFAVTNTESGESVSVEPEPFYHRFTDLAALFDGVPAKITLTFPAGAVINEIYVFTEGEVPQWVQKWKPPVEDGADLVLFSTHGDDEQLFFSGVLPYYAGEKGYKVQVVYLTDHREKEPHRIHEMLNGLWSVGVRYYPVSRPYPDFILQYELNGTYNGYLSYGITKEELVDYVVEQLRRFKPTVAVGHDIKGEYGHGMHMMYTDMLRQALELSNDPAYHQDSAERYGLWDVPKTYLHLYEENPIVMNWDVPLEHFGGMTAYQVSKEIGYPCHESQYADFYWYYVEYKTAAELPRYNPCYYGLYRSLVGEDVQKNDFFENVICYTEQAKLDELRRQEEEAARLKAEEEARLREEEARKKAEQEAAEELKRQREEEQRRLQAEAEAAARLRQQRRMIAAGVITIAVISMLFMAIKMKKQKKSEK